MEIVVDFLFNSDTVVQWMVGVGSSVLALLLMLIKIPQSDYARKLANSKMAIVVSFLICAFMMFFSISRYRSPEVTDFAFFSMLIIYIVVYFSTSVISYSMISLLKVEKHPKERLFVPGTLISIVIAFMLLDSYLGQNNIYFFVMCVISIVVYTITTIIYIVHFDRAYKHSLKELEEYYDDDEGDKIKWVRFCYVISMLTNCFVIVYIVLYFLLPFKMQVAQIYTLWYLLYMLYFTSNFLSFLGSHKLVLDAFAHGVLSGKALPSMPKRKKEEKVNLPREFAKLEKSIDEWVAAGKFREYDKTRDEVAKEMNTSKEVLHHYFASVKNIDFRTWRTQLRIENAKTMLLEEKNLSTHIIAEKCGFSDRSNFHRQFTKIVGCSPKEWREADGKI